LPLPAEHAAYGGASDQRSQVADCGDFQVAETSEDLADEDQHGEVERRCGPDEPGAPQQADRDGGDDNVGRPDVDQVAVSRWQRAVRDPVRDDAFADQRADELARDAGQERAPVAEQMIGAEQGQRDEERPGGRQSNRDERGRDQGAGRMMLQVVHAGAGPARHGGLVAARQERIDDLGHAESDEVQPRRGIPAQNRPDGVAWHPIRLGRTCAAS
jgi:hypothetical protein